MKLPGCNWLAINSLWCEIWWTKDKLKGTVGKAGLLDPVSFAGWVSSPKEGRNPGFCPWLHHCGDMQLHPPVPWCSWVLKRRNLFLYLSKCEDLPHIFRLYCRWFTRSVEDCGEAFEHGREVPMLDSWFQCLCKDYRNMEVLVCRDCWRFYSPASPFKQHSHQP